MLKIVNSTFMEYLIKEDLHRIVIDYMQQTETSTRVIYVENFFDAFVASNTQEGASHWATVEQDFYKYKEDCMLQVLLKSLGVSVGAALVEKLVPEITNTLSTALDDFSNKTSEIFEGVFSDEEPKPLVLEKQKPAKTSDTYKFTKEDHDYICQEYAAHNEKRKELGYLVPYRILVEKLNNHLGLHKSQTSYARIWSNKITRESLPNEKTKSIFGG